MAMERLLPVKDPRINCYSYYANPLAILSVAANKKYFPWFLSNFIQLSSHPEGSSIKLDFFQQWITWVPYYCPFLDVQIINKDIFGKLNVISFIVDCIDSGYYIHMKVNHKYLSASSLKWYNRTDYAHELLIYGYNTNTQTLELADNFGGKYKFARCTFEEFQLAYSNPPIYNTANYEKVLLLKPKEDIIFQFDLLKVKDSLEDFLASRDTRIRDDQSSSWARNLTLGVDVYDKIIDYLFLLIDKKASIDLRLFHVLWEHKKCMIDRIRYMETLGIIRDPDIVETYQGLEKIALIYRNQMIKLTMRKDTRKINAMIQGVKSLSITEISLIHKVLEQIYMNAKKEEHFILGNSNRYELKWCLG
ncbi:hypothetical protein [Paenibacillus tuaregi]|uniref:hypothetical protein n=1 Tax=Paenibacillus tuaregi TaxID=1816681 RepID=UPI0008399A8F|nr:hypothetical protein [Paenibacillus tuaregi]